MERKQRNLRVKVMNLDLVKRRSIKKTSKSYKVYKIKESNSVVK